MVGMGRVALDGTELEANASKHKATSYGRPIDKEERVEGEIAELEAKAAVLPADAEAADTAEDQAFGSDGKDTDLPAEPDSREKRLAGLQAARPQIEAEAAEKARRHAEDKARRRQERAGVSDGQAVTDTGQAAADQARPKRKAQADFTDPDSRIMKNSDGAPRRMAPATTSARSSDTQEPPGSPPWPPDGGPGLTTGPTRLTPDGKGPATASAD